MKNITVFKDFSTPDQPYYTDLDTIVARIRGDHSKAAIEKLRSISDGKEADRLKKQLPCICFSGKFETINGVETYVALPEGDYPKDKAIRIFVLFDYRDLLIRYLPQFF